MSWSNSTLTTLAYSNGFTFHAYQTEDPQLSISPADEPGILDPGYFNPAAVRVKKGDIILVTINHPRDKPSGDMLMVTHVDEDKQEVQVTSLLR